MLYSQRNWFVRYWALAAGAAFLATAVGKAEEPKDIFFYDDYNKAIHEAKLTQKPIFLEFRCAP
jgi:hypothetical protein